MKHLERMTAFLSSIVAITVLLGTVDIASGATDTWSSSPAGATWNSTDWTGGNAPPQTNDALVFGTSTGTTLNNDFPALSAFDGLTFTGTSAFTLNGNSVLLSGALLSNHVGIANFSGLTQTFGTMSLTLDSGYYTFTSSSGSVALGGLTINPGGVAYLDANNTSSVLANDGSGLISGLGGAGLTYGGATFGGLATMSGGSVATYSGWPSVVAAPGAIGATTPGAAVNIELTGTTAGNYTYANGTGITYANTIFLNNASGATLVVGSTAGAQTLDLGAVSGIGGIYVPAGATAQAVTIGSGASTILTAGPETGSPIPGTIVFGVNGTSSAGQALNNSTIKDNLSGGAVTVVKTGTGSMISGATLANTYTGGTYVDQGEYQGNSVNSFGPGPVYVSTGASVYFQAGGVNYSNELYLSSGTGAPTAASASLGAFTWGSAANTDVTLSGKIHLLGAPAPIGPGVRISTQATSRNLIITGQITGTGTLDISQGGHSGNTILSNILGNNNWTGGVVLDPRSTLSVFFKMGANNQLPSGPGTGDFTIAAASTGDVRLDLNGFNATINALNASGSGQVGKQELSDFGTANSTLTMGANNSNGSFSGITQDASGRALSLVKIGTGTQTFNGSANFGYLGNTTVSNGTFALAGFAGQIPSSPVITIAAPATLDASATGLGGLSLGAAQTINGIGTLVGSTAINGKINPFLGTIGTLTNNGNVALNGGSTYVWSINDATGTAGSDPGWSLLNVTSGGTITINANSGSPMTIKVTSLSGGVPGNAAHFSNSGTTSWVIAKSTVPIIGFAQSAFTIDHSAFSNPLGSGAFSIGLSLDQMSLVLTFSGTPTISTPLANQTNNLGSTAVFTVVANGATPPITFDWLQGVNPLSDGGTSAGGATVGITNSGHTSTLTLTGVQDADAGGITVNVSDTLGDSGSSSATLTVVDPPNSPFITQSSANSPVNAGARDTLTASAGGSQPFTYQWYLGTNAISGATGSNLVVNVSGANSGIYTVVIGNQAGSVSNTFTIAPVDVVPNQIIFEPFDSYVAQNFPPPNPASWQGVTNVFNQLTGEPAFWTLSGAASIMTTMLNDMDNGAVNQFGGEYPWPGLAGNSPNCLYWSSASPNNHLRVTTNGSALFAAGGPNTNIYFSFVWSAVSLGTGSFDGNQDVVAGFSTSAGTTALNLELCTQVTSGGAGQYALGIAKASGANGQALTGTTASPLPHIALGPTLQAQVNYFVVGCYSVVSGGTVATDDTVSLWVNPDPATFNSAAPPAPNVGPVNFGVKNSAIQDFVIHGGVPPASRRITDLRIGTTWASVTPPSAPSLSLGNVYSPLGTTAVLASQNAGNLVTLPYGWQLNNGSPLTDGPTGNGSTLTGSATATLTISNVQAADLGIYTVTGTNVDLAPDHNNTNLVGSTSAILSSQPPRLNVVRSAPNVTILWPTNWIGYQLEQTPSVFPTSWTTNSLPPYPVSSTNNAVTVPAPGTEYYRLIKH